MTAGKEKQIYSKCGERSPANVGVDSMSERRELPSRHEHVTQKVRVPARTLYITVHRDPNPAELLLRMKGEGCTVEVVALYDVIARLASLALQYRAPLEKVGDMLQGTKFEPAGPVQGDPRIKFTSSPLNYVGRHLGVHFLGRDDLAHVPADAVGVACPPSEESPS